MIGREGWFEILLGVASGNIRVIAGCIQNPCDDNVEKIKSLFFLELIKIKMKKNTVRVFFFRMDYIQIFYCILFLNMALPK